MLPGTYTIKMTKGDKVYTTKLDVVIDPRAKYTVDDRKAQFDLAMKLSQMLNHMSWAVDSIISLREGAQARAAQLKSTDALRSQLNQLAASADAVRSKIVATKEGGMITGEERLREYLAGLYSDVNAYDGRPTESQVGRADVLGRELEDVIHEFRTLTDQQLPAINKKLAAKKIQPISVITEEQWQNKERETASSGQPGRQMREMD